MMNGMFNMPQPPNPQGQVKINPYIEAAKKNPQLKFPGAAPFNQNDPAWKEYMKWEQATHAGGPPDASKIATILGMVHKAKGGFIGPRQPQPVMPNTDASAGQGGMQVPMPVQNAPEGQAEAFNMPSTIVPPAPPEESKLDMLFKELQGERTKDKFRSLEKGPERKQYTPDKKKQLLIMLLGGLASYLGGGTDRAESVNAFARTFGQGIQQDAAEGQQRFDKEYEDAVSKQKERARLANQSRDDIMQQAQLAIQEENSKTNKAYRESIAQNAADALEQKTATARGTAANKAAQTWINLANSALQGKDPTMYAESMNKAQRALKGLAGDLSADVASEVTRLEVMLDEQAKQAVKKTQQMEKNLTAADAALKMVGIKTDREALKLKFETETFDEDLLIKAAKVTKAQADAGKARADVSSVGRVYSRYSRHTRGVVNDMVAVESGKPMNTKELATLVKRTSDSATEARQAVDFASKMADGVKPGDPGYEQAKQNFQAANDRYKDLMDLAAKASSQYYRAMMGPSKEDKAKARFMGAKASTKIPKKK